MLVPMASAANWVQFEIKELDGSSDLSTDYFDADSVMCQVDANGDLERIYYWEKRVYPSTTDSKIDYQIGFVRYDKAHIYTPSRVGKLAGKGNTHTLRAVASNSPVSLDLILVS